MNEEQLKEIAILAKEIGFKPRTFSTAELFFNIIDNVRGVDVEHVASYLLLCEIHLWLVINHCIIIEISRGSVLNKFTVFIEYLPHGYIYENNNPKNFDTYPQALATGILEGLKLITTNNNG